MRIGIFGGTFDPPHVGHLIVASDVCTRLALDRLLWIPAAAPPHKRGRVGATPELRLQMTRAAIAGDPRFEVDDLELRRTGPSYSVDTLRAIRGRLPDAEVFFVLGVDQLQEFHTWRDPDEVARLARLAVVEREGEILSADVGYSVTEVVVTRVDISSTIIRARVERGESIRYLVPEPVRELVEREGLYRASSEF